MQYDEIRMMVFDGKIIPMLEFASKNLAEDPEVIAGSNRHKTAMLKFVNAQLAEIEEFFDDDGSFDDRDNQSDADLFGDDDIAVGPGRTTATGFMDPPDSADDFTDDDGEGPDLDSGLGDYDDGFPK